MPKKSNLNLSSHKEQPFSIINIEIAEQSEAIAVNDLEIACFLATTPLRLFSIQNNGSSLDQRTSMAFFLFTVTDYGRAKHSLYAPSLHEPTKIHHFCFRYFVHLGVFLPSVGRSRARSFGESHQYSPNVPSGFVWLAVCVSGVQLSDLRPLPDFLPMGRYSTWVRRGQA